MRIVIFGAALILMGFGVHFSYGENVGAATATYGAGGLCLIFAFLKEFRSFKAFGVEAELRGKIEEADTLLTQLRSLVTPMSELLFTMVARGGRWDSHIPRDESYRMMSQFEEQLAKLGVPNKDIEAAKKDWHKYNLVDLASPIVSDIGERISIIAKEKRDNINSFRSPIGPDVREAHSAAIEDERKVSAELERLQEVYQLPDMHGAHDVILNFIDSTVLFSDSVKSEIRTTNEEQLQDLEYYGENHDFRRLDVWFANDH